MNSRLTRDDTNYRVTTEQIGRLERGLLSLMESSRSSPEVRGAIAAVQYQEILQLRAELDAAMGFAEAACDLEVSLSGPNIGIGAAPASALSGFLTNLRAAMQAVTAYLMTGELPGKGRLPRYVTQPTEIQFVGAASGSLRLMLNLPEPRTISPDSDPEAVKRGLRLLLAVVDWASSTEEIETLSAKVDDVRLARLLLDQVQRIGPKPRSEVKSIKFSSRLVDPNETYMLSHKSMGKIRGAIESIPKGSIETTTPIALPAIAFDSGKLGFTQRIDEQTYLRCVIPRERVPQFANYLGEEAMVVIAGVLEYDRSGRPSGMRVQEVFAADDAD